MAERDAVKRAAPVPSLAEPGQQLVGRENDFAHLNKQLRACFVCKLVKAMPQWMDGGCDNCRWIETADMESLDSYTTTNFSGMMTLMEPSASWVAKWTHTAKCVPGCYALTINEEIPPEITGVAGGPRHAPTVAVVAARMGQTEGTRGAGGMECWDRTCCWWPSCTTAAPLYSRFDSE